MRFPPFVIQAALRRAKGHCEGWPKGSCGMPTGPSNQAQVDHIKEVWEGGTATLDNAQVLGHKCCHRRKSAEATKRRAKADRQSRAISGGKKSKWRPMPGTRRSGWKHRMDGGWERR